MSDRSLTMSLRSYANWIVSCAGGNVPPEAADAYEAADMIEGLLVALHDAIDRPKGVVPASADRFYDPQRFYAAPPAASGPLNTALNIHVPGRFCSLTPSHLSLLAALEAQREHDARRRA